MMGEAYLTGMPYLEHRSQTRGHRRPIHHPGKEARISHRNIRPSENSYPIIRSDFEIWVLSVLGVRNL